MRKWTLFGLFNIAFIALVIFISINAATSNIEVAPDPDLVTNSYGGTISDGPASAIYAKEINALEASVGGLIIFFGSYLFLGAVIWMTGIARAALNGIADGFGGRPLTSKRTAPENEEIVVISEKHHIYRIGSRIYNIENGVARLLNDLND